MANGRDQSHYRPYLDGVRCLAVYLVVAFHAGLGAFPGGFIGVDMFFVLSGYLVTRLLLRDLSQRGRIEFRRFYSRRVRRILPAAGLALACTALAYATIATPAQMLDALGGFKAAFLYVANWFFIHQSVDYFAPNVNSSPVLHFWSLAVEEQFYLLWPLGLSALYLLTRRAGRMRWWVLRVAIGIGAIASVTEAIHLAASNVDRAYYGTDTRAYQLLAGALLALTPQLFRLGAPARRAARWVGGLALAGVALVASSAIHLGPISRGIVVTGLTCLLIIAVENARGGAVVGALSASPIAYLGRLSYGTYLWHWPIDVIATHNRTVQPAVLFVLSATVATFLAAMSYHLFEHPIRMSTFLNRYRVPVIAAGLTASIIGGLVFVPAIFDIGGAGSGASTLDWRAAQTDRIQLPDCLNLPASLCTVVKGTGLRVVLMGDSHARMWAPAFEAIAKQESWTLSVAILPRCPWQLGVQYSSSTAGEQKVCAEHQDDWYNRMIPELNPDVVVVSHQAYDDPAFHPFFTLPKGVRGSVDKPGVERALQAYSGASVQRLEREGRRVVILEPTPIAPNGFDPISCISAGGPLSGCEYRANPSLTPLERFYRSLAVPGQVASVDVDRLVCPRLPICDPVVHGLIVKRDGSHLTATYSTYLGPALDAALQHSGVLGRRR